jgi:hypothetical protein
LGQRALPGARWRALLAAALSLAALTVTASVTSTAYAGEDYYCPGWDGFYYTADCYGPDHKLRQARAHDLANSSLVVGAYATYASSTVPYASTVWGVGYACHPYSGDNVLRPWVANTSGNAKLGGHSYWGTEPSCP